MFSGQEVACYLDEAHRSRAHYQNLPDAIAPGNFDEAYAAQVRTGLDAAACFSLYRPFTPLHPPRPLPQAVGPPPMISPPLPILAGEASSRQSRHAAKRIT